MRPIHLPNGNLLVPFCAEEGDISADGTEEVTPDDPRYEQWVRWERRLDAALGPDFARPASERLGTPV